MTVKPPFEALRLSERERDSLLQLKRLTGIEHWNVLCRWAFVVSVLSGPLAESSEPASPTSSVEMGWPTFAGQAEGGFLALMTQGGSLDKAVFCRRHLARGIALLHARTQTGPGGRRADPLRLVAALGL